MQTPLLQYLRLFGDISVGDEDYILSRFLPKRFGESELLTGPDKIAREMFFVMQGVSRIASVNEKGTEVTHYFYAENQLISIIQSFNEDIPSPAFIQACTDLQTLTITKSSLLDLYHQIPYLKSIIDRQNQQHLIEKLNTRNAYLGEDAPSRYRLFLDQHPMIANRVPQKYIASYLGITPQSLSRIRKQQF